LFYIDCLVTLILLTFHNSSELVWSSLTARSIGLQLDGSHDPLSTVPFNIREAAMVELARRDYDISLLDELSIYLQPKDGSTWSIETKEKYHAEMFRTRKNILAVSKSLHIPFGTCMIYYLGTFKNSKDYIVLKHVRIEEKLQKIEATGHMVDKCGICGEGGSLLICDECEGEYHIACVNPPLASVPDGRWECDECVDRKLLLARDSMVRSLPLFEKTAVTGRTSENRASVANNEESTSLYKPTAKVLDGLRQFVHDINQAVAKKLIR
jgi:PHD-finger